MAAIAEVRSLSRNTPYMTNSVPILATLSTGSRLRSMMGMWAVAAFLPLPVLALTDPDRSADLSCLYLAISNALLVTESHRSWGLPGSVSSWRARTRAIATVIFVNVALFIGFGLVTGVQTHFPFPLMAVLSVLPAIGVLPWMLRRVSTHPYAAVVFTGFLVGACKIAGCIAARVVYGPEALAQGYMAADWRTAKLMLTMLWTLSTLLSLALLYADYRYFARRDAGRAA